MQTLPPNLLGEVLQYCSFRRIIAVSMTCHAVNHLVAGTLDAAQSEGASWWQRKVARDCQNESDQAAQRNHGLLWSEVYLVASYRFMTVIRAVVEHGGRSALLSYLLVTDMEFGTTSYAAAHRYVLSPSDLVYLHQHGLEDVIWHNIEFNKEFPTVYPDSKEHLLSERILSSSRMTPSLLLRAMRVLTCDPDMPCLHMYIKSIVTNPNARSALAALLLVAFDRTDQSVATVVAEYLPADCSVSELSELLYAVIFLGSPRGSMDEEALQHSKLNVAQHLLDRGASPNETARGDETTFVPLFGITVSQMTILAAVQEYRPVQAAFARKDAEMLRMLVSSPAFVTAAIDTIDLSETPQEVKTIVAPLIIAKVITQRDISMIPSGITVLYVVYLRSIQTPGCTLCRRTSWARCCTIGPSGGL